MLRQRSVVEYWSDIEHWLQSHVPTNKFKIASAATREDLAEAEKIIGVQLPAQLHEFYSTRDGSNGIWVCQQGYLLPMNKPGPLSSVLRRWQAMKDMLEDGTFTGDDFISRPKGPIQVDWWNTGWIPIVYDKCGDYLCVDMVPAEGGRVGQIIHWWHEQGATTVVASSFLEWIANLAQDLSAGKYRINSAGDLEYTSSP